MSVVVFSTLLICITFFAYFNNTDLANPQVVGYYKSLKLHLRSKGFSDQLLVISSKRFKWHNAIQVKLSGAAVKSQHLEGDAIDFLVFDVNKDGQSDDKDVNIVYEILDEEIVNNNGGIGTYKNEGIFSRQMIHIDCRGFKARWHR